MADSRLKKLVTYLRPYWREVLLGTIALLVVNGISVYIPLLIRDIIERLRQEPSFGLLWRHVVPIPILASLMWGIRMMSRIILFGIGRQVEFDLKQKIFQHLLILEPAYFAKNTSGDLISRATNDVDSIRRLLGFAVLSIANTFFAYSLTLPLMLAINPSLSLAAIAVYPLMLVVVQLFSHRLQAQQLAVQQKLSELSESIQEDVSGIASIKIYAQEENERVAFQKKNRQLLNANLQLARTRTLLFPLIESLSYISLLVLLWLGSREIAKGTIDVGDFVALVIYVENLVFPTALLGFTLSTYQRGEVSIDRIEAILSAQPSVKDLRDTIALPVERVKGEIKANHLSYTYPGSVTPALRDVSFTISCGETVAIVGPIGAGKSTLANAMTRLLDIKEGQLFLDGKDITKIKLAHLRRAIAYVPQESFLFSNTIKDNIRYGEPLIEGAEVERAAKLAQIHSEINNFPQQYETLVGERGITLSGGQRQRTSIARALLVDAPILILDDALSSVDNQTATSILQNLSETRGKTVIFISHQLSAAASADRILVMEGGEIIQSGTHSQLSKHPGLYQTLWQQHQLKEGLD